ncbi:hypothetical protein [Halobaculum gomorrense]|uniref:Uncharacterized protein n=1 Tax=Halobaculum gomorrense TaxID=43928 RepID=A0A1M5RPX3_9EURY|nr:hypothetical protein [Halobaculum gomorrense]SHH28312.1 hypothetical protein SAMN05443636_2275 [Halobaculum gomorrense]
MSRNDPIAAALLSESAYQRSRYRRFGWFNQSLTRKLTLQSYLLYILAAVLPVLTLLPSRIRGAYLGGPIAETAPRVCVAALAAAVIVAAGGLGLIGVALFVLVRGDELTDETARAVRSVERAASMAGLATGGVATVAVVSFALIGFGGVDAVTAWVAAGGGNPYASSGVGLPVATVAVAVLGLGIALRVAAALFRAHGLGDA